MNSLRTSPRPLSARWIRANLWLVALALLVVAGLAVYWVALLAEHDQKVRSMQAQTELRSAQLAKTLAVQSQTLFAGLDFVAQNLVAEYAWGNADDFDLAVRTASTTFPARAILQIAVADREGQVVYSSLQKPSTPLAAASIRDRTHFRVHADAAKDAGLFISQPVMGRVSRQWTVQITRAIRKEGRFEGVVVVSVAPSYLSGFFREILEHPNSVILLLREDGAYLARSAAEDEVLGKSVPADREFLTHPQQRSGYYAVVAPVDGIEREYAWHRVPGLPLVVSVGLDKASIWAPVHDELRGSLVRSGIASALVVAGAVLVSWLWLRRREAESLAARSEELLRKLVSQVPGALFQLEVRPGDGARFRYASPGLAALHQVAPDAAVRDGERVFDRLHPDDLQRVRSEMNSAAATLTPWRGHYRVPGPGGALRWMRATAKPEPCDPDGVLWHGYVEDVTQEHELQEALRLSEEHLRLTMDAVNDGLWQWTLTTDQVHWDARCWEMLGYPAIAGDLPRSMLLEWMHPDDRERFTQRVESHLERGEPYHCEIRLRTAAGQWAWIESRGRVIDSADGRPVRMLGTHTDVSERVAQSQLRRALLDENAAAILLATPDRRIAQANQRAEGMFGPPGGTVVGQSLRIVHTDDASFDAFGEWYGQLRERGLVRAEWMFRLQDGSNRWCDVHGALLDPQDPDGLVIWTVVDADDRHRAEAALRVAQQRLTAIIDRFPGGVMVQEGLYGPVVAMNQALCDILGLQAPVQQLSPDIEARIRDVLPADMLNDEGAGVVDVPPLARSVEQKLPDGRTFEVHRVPLWGDGRSLGLFWMLRDITERKQRESTLEQLAATDPLTTLPNRRFFMARLQQEFDGVRHHGAEPAVLLMLDIDFFKQVNDTWGHAAGDQVLHHMAGLLRQELRQRDMAARLGGEEFAVLLAGTHLAGGQQMAERLRTVIADSPAPTDQGPVSFTVSVGLSVLDASLHSVNAGLERADAALYEAKRSGRNRVSTWAPGRHGAGGEPR